MKAREEPRGTRAQLLPGLISAAAAEASDTVIFVTDAEGVITWVNPAFTAVTGYSPEEAIGKNPRILQSGLQDIHYYRRLWNAIKAGESFSSAVVNRKRSGDLYSVFQTVTPLPPGSKSPTQFIAMQEDISNEIEYERQLEYLAFTDPLTGLGNRRALFTRLAEAERRREPVALMLLDMDDFKGINDRFGHAQGDLALQRVAKSMLHGAPGGSHFRLGGDEFVVAMFQPAGPLQEIAIANAWNIVEEVRTPPAQLDGPELSVSIGLAVALGGRFDSDALLNSADLALNVAKDGGSSVEVFHPSMGEASRRAAKLREDLGPAINSGRLTVAYQPIFDVASGKATSFEVLARWHHPRFGDVAPDEFIPIAESSGLIHVLGYEVLRQSMSRYAELCRASGLRLAVNVSPAQFGRPDFPWRLLHLMRETGMPPHLLDLEVTEASRLEEHAAGGVILALQKFGVGLVVDDWGAGFSRISYLAEFPMTALKLDRALLQNVAQSKRHQELVRGIIMVAHSMGVRVIGEGIETEAHLEYLRELGCDEGQGFLLGRPESEISRRLLAA